MSSLGLSLLILIVVAIGALAAYNFWLTRKPSARSDDFETGFSSSPTSRQEPSFSSGATEPYLPDAPAADAEAAPPAASFAPSPPPAMAEPADQAVASDEPPAKPEVTTQGASDWSAGVLPDAPPAPPPPPDLNWQSGPSAEPKQAAQANPSPSFEASIEEAMRLQREADEVIESAPSGPTEGGIAEAGPLSGSADLPPAAETETDSSATDEFAPGAPDDAPDRSAEHQANQVAGLGTLPAMDLPEVPTERPAQAPLEPQTEPPSEGLADSLPAGKVAAPVPDFAAESAVDGGSAQNTEEAQQQAEPLTPGWSGIDSDRQAANFVATVNVELSSPTKGAELIARTRELKHAGTKPVRITAGNPPAVGQSVIRTEPIKPDRDYALLRFELLQVNRHGPLDGVEYSSFVAAVDSIGESLGVLVNPPDMNVVLIKSRVLDAEVASLDAQVAVNVETEDPIANERFVALAEEIGLSKRDTRDTGRDTGADTEVYVANDDGGYAIYTAQLNSEANRIVLVLDVPAVPRELQPVRKMVEGAWAFAQALNGRMTDDNGRAIDNALFERIESQIETHYQALLAAGVPAGSDLARQVYNQV